jgi:hypothetical protein
VDNRPAYVFLFKNSRRVFTGSVEFERVVDEKLIRIQFQRCQLLSIQAQTGHADRSWRQSLPVLAVSQYSCNLNLRRIEFLMDKSLESVLSGLGSEAEMEYSFRGDSTQSVRMVP